MAGGKERRNLGQLQIRVQRGAPGRLCMRHRTPMWTWAEHSPRARKRRRRWWSREPANRGEADASRKDGMVDVERCTLGKDAELEG